MTVMSPLAIRADHSPGGAGGIKYIPGTTFIGALASLHRLLYQDNAEEGKTFEELFLQGQVLYSNLYPAIFDHPGLQGRNKLPVYPLPKTAQSCKRHGGFRFPNDVRKNDGHGVRDTLIDWTLFKLISSDERLAKTIKPLAIMQDGKDCHCGEAMDSFDGYYRQSDRKPYDKIAAKVESYIRMQTHTGIDRESGTVQDRILYNRQVFEEDMRFWGKMSFPDDERLLIQFEQFIKKIGPPGMLRLGTGRTRGMGRVQLDTQRVEEGQISFDAFTKRLELFNEKLRERADGLGLTTLPYRYFFALTLHSPLILCDDLFRYHSTIDTDVLKNLLESAIPEIDYTVPELTRIYYTASMRSITGWQELWGTPRMSEHALDSGSVFLFACSSPPDQNMLKALYALEEQGIGKRRAEGFGRVCVSDPFHQQTHQEGTQS
jgi:CRISPR-associated Csx10 family RAMP protein